MASRGGADHHPAWYINLTANPDVKVTMYGKTRPMRARTASPRRSRALAEIVGVHKLRGLPAVARAGHPRGSSAYPSLGDTATQPYTWPRSTRLRPPSTPSTPARPPDRLPRPGHYDALNVAGARWGR